MADVKYLEEKVISAEEKVSKCEGTIERHKKALEKKLATLVKDGIAQRDSKDEGFYDVLTSDQRWLVFEYTNKLDDIKGATRKLREAEEVLQNWREKLDLQREKDRFLDGNAPAVIREFLENWKKQAYDWHVKRYEDTLVLKEKLRKEEKEAKAELGVREGNFPNWEQEKELKARNLDYRSINTRIANFAGSAVLKMMTYYVEAERLAWLEKTLEEEKKAKMLDLINRINKVVGAITDAKLLRVDVKGNLNGIIVGEQGTAKVETIGAGGYNIQCFHFRTLVNEI